MYSLHAPVSMLTPPVQTPTMPFCGISIQFANIKQLTGLRPRAEGLTDQERWWPMGWYS